MSKLLKLADLVKKETRDATVPGVEGVVRFKLLRGLDYVEALALRDSQPKFMVELIARSLVDDDGNRIYSDDVLEQVRELTWDVLQSLFEQIVEANGISTKKREEAAKNSETGGDSPSSSPAISTV
ncbi:MAG: hypothetical protein U0744_02600 [Gemmataceae bacterium]